MIYRYLNCGDLDQGFARVKCKDCGHILKDMRECLPALSCKEGISVLPVTRSAWWNSGRGDAWKTSTLKSTRKRYAHRHFEFSIPKILCRYFLYNKKLPASLSLSGFSFFRGEEASREGFHYLDASLTPGIKWKLGLSQ